MKRILYIITQSELGGAQRYIFDLATNLPSDKYEAIVAAGGNDQLSRDLNEAGIKTYHLKNLIRSINPLKDYLAYLEIKKLIKKIKPDVVHLNSSKISIIGSLAAHNTGIKKIIYTVHGFVFNEPLSKAKKTIYKYAEKLTSKYKYKLICVSGFDRQTGIVNKISSPDKLVVIHNGISQDNKNYLTQEDAKKALKIPQDCRVIGTIANFYPTKGLEYLIKAAKTVTQTFPDVCFVIIGDDAQSNDHKKQIKKLNLEQKIILTGSIPEAQQYLKAFEIFTLPSVKEGFPLAILEAMQSQTPIISTNVGGIPEIIKDSKNGLLVEPKDPQALAVAINNLLQNKNLANQFASQAFEDVQNNFSLKKTIEKTIELY